MGDLADEIRQAIEVVPATPAGGSPARTTRSREAPLLVGAIDPAAAITALGLSRRGLTIGAAVLMSLGSFVIVRAALRPRPKPVAAHEVAPAPPPMPAPPPPAAPTPTDTVTPPPPAEAPEPTPAEPPARTAPARPLRKGLAAAPVPNGAELLKQGQLMLQNQQFDKARDAFGKARGSKSVRGKALVGLANVAFQEKKYDEAIAKAKESTKSGGGVDANNLIGDVYYKMEKYADAKKAYAAALKASPGNEHAKRMLDQAAKRAN